MGPVYAQRFPDLLVVTTNHGPFNEQLADIYRNDAHRVPIIAISMPRSPLPKICPSRGSFITGSTPRHFKSDSEMAITSHTSVE